MPFTLIPFLLLAIPLMEIGVFIIVGSQIGVFPTLAMVVVTAIVGSILLRVQGFGLLARMRADIDAGRVPGRDLVHGVMILIAGILLLTPGFVTDTLGFLLFVPAIRDAIWKFARSRITIVSSMGGRTGPGPDRGPDYSPRGDRGTIDLNQDEYSEQKDGSSPWSNG